MCTSAQGRLTSLLWAEVCVRNLPQFSTPAPPILAYPPCVHVFSFISSPWLEGPELAFRLYRSVSQALVLQAETAPRFPRASLTAPAQVGCLSMKALRRRPLVPGWTQPLVEVDMCVNHLWISALRSTVFAIVWLEAVLLQGVGTTRCKAGFPQHTLLFPLPYLGSPSQRVLQFFSQFSDGALHSLSVFLQVPQGSDKVACRHDRDDYLREKAAAAMCEVVHKVACGMLALGAREVDKVVAPHRPSGLQYRGVRRHGCRCLFHD